MEIKIAGITKESIVDGKGIRYVVFTQGCPHACRGCHNPESWSFDGGYEKSVDEIFDEFKKNPLLKGVTFSGGEPFLQPKPLIKLAKLCHSVNKDVLVYSGYTYEELKGMKNEDVTALLEECDILIDGKYEESLKNLELLFKGSENQRIIDLKESKKEGKAVISKGYDRG